MLIMPIQIRMPPRAERTFLNPTVERIYGLNNQQVPPLNYAGFLNKTVGAFSQLVSQKYGVQTLEDVARKYRDELKKLNPDQPDALFRGLSPAITLGFSGQLRLLKPESSDRVPNQVYQSREYTEDFFHPYLGGTRIPFNGHEQKIEEIVETITQELDKRYPDRQGLLYFKDSENGENLDICQFLHGFGFTLNLKSLPADHLEVDVELKDYGTMGSDMENMAAMPSIGIKAGTLFGLLDFPQNVVDILGNLVMELYETDAIEYRQSYTKEKIL